MIASVVHTLSSSPEGYSAYVTIAQVWLLLNRLLVDSQWRSKCLTEDTARAERVVKLRQLMSEPLVAALPFLKGLAFMLEQLAMGCREINTALHSSFTPVIEQVRDK